MPKKGEFELIKTLSRTGITEKDIEKFPVSFRSEIFESGRLKQKLSKLSFQHPHVLMAYVILTSDLEESDFSGISGDDVRLWEDLYADGLTLNDVASSWSKALIDDLDDADREEKEGSKIYGYERELLIKSMTADIVIDGRLDKRIVSYFFERELSWAWREVVAIEENEIEEKSFGRRILRMKDAHEAGVTLMHMAQGAAIILSR